jgi:hypothetical protein
MSGKVQPGTARNRRWLAAASLLALALTVAFGWTTWQAHAAFRQYRDATLHDRENPPRWTAQVYDLEACVGEAMAWVAACPGLPSWCDAALSEPLNLCLDSQDRKELCAQLGDSVLSTRFGFTTCKARYESIEDTYQRRAAKKACAAAHRVVAEFCQAKNTAHANPVEAAAVN